MFVVNYFVDLVGFENSDLLANRRSISLLRLTSSQPVSTAAMKCQYENEILNVIHAEQKQLSKRSVIYLRCSRMVWTLTRRVLADRGSANLLINRSEFGVTPYETD